VCCDKITDISLDKLGESCPELQRVYTRGCPLITRAAKDRLRQRVPGVALGL